VYLDIINRPYHINVYNGSLLLPNWKLKQILVWYTRRPNYLNQSCIFFEDILMDLIWGPYINTLTSTVNYSSYALDCWEHWTSMKLSPRTCKLMGDHWNHTSFAEYTEHLILVPKGYVAIVLLTFHVVCLPCS
jgi:hypothetical protein